MKEFLLSVLASLIAAFLLFLAPAITSFISNGDVSITVSNDIGNFGKHKLLSIQITNSTGYAIEPLLFESPQLQDMKILGVNGVQNETFDTFPSQGLEISLPADASVIISLIASYDGSLTDLVSKVSGKYSFINEKGRVEDDNVIVKTITEKRYDQTMTALKWVGLFLLILILSLAYIYAPKLFKKQKDSLS